MLLHKIIYAFKIFLNSPSAFSIFLFKHVQSLYIKILSYILTNKYSCNVCNKTSWKFISDNWHSNIICPHCFSEIRHRLFFAYLNNSKFNIKLESFKEKHILHFAPEGCFKKKFKNISSNYKTADFNRKGYDYSLDISNMNEIENSTFDYLIAFDVIEHVHDINKCFNEIHRVIKDDGLVFVSVPQIDYLQKTIFYDGIENKSHKLNKFGQIDHSNLFGSDFKEILIEYNFDVNVIENNLFENQYSNNYILKPKKTSTKKFATNDRKIYILKKN